MTLDSADTAESYLPIEIWVIIAFYLSLVDRTLLSWTCKKLFYAVNKSTHQASINSLLRDKVICNQNWNTFMQDCLNKIEDKYYLIYKSKCDKRYFAYVKQLLSYHLRLVYCLFVYCHLFYCRRKNIFEASCQLCIQVVRWEVDKKAGFKYERYFVSGWSDHKNDIFCTPKFFSYDLNKKCGGCSYFEALNNPNELVEMFGTISVRIMLNIIKRYLICNEEHAKLVFDAYLSEISHQIFNFVCQNINMSFAWSTFDIYRPYFYYNASSLKIVNLKYLQYLKDNENNKL